MRAWRQRSPRARPARGPPQARVPPSSLTRQARCPHWGRAGAERRTVAAARGLVVGILPMRNGSGHGAAPEGDIANACIYNIHHTAPEAEGLPCAETFCGILYQRWQYLLRH